MASKTQKPFVLKVFIRNALRRVFARTQPYHMCRKKVEKVEYTAGGAKRCFFRCEHCNKLFPRKETQVDHVHPVQPLDGHDPDYNEFIELLFNGKLQCLCKECHKTKSAAESTERAESRRVLKDTQIVAESRPIGTPKRSKRAPAK